MFGGGGCGWPLRHMCSRISSIIPRTQLLGHRGAMVLKVSPDWKPASATQTRVFSTGNWYVLTSGKLFEKRKRKQERRQRRAQQMAQKKATGKRKLTAAELVKIKGDPRKALRNEKLQLPPFHSIQRNRFNRIVEPTAQFRLVITPSKNNVWITAQATRPRPGDEPNLWRLTKTLFETYAGNIGIRKRAQQRSATAYALGVQMGRKCKRFGITWVDVVFRRGMRVAMVLRGLKQHVKLKSITHIPSAAPCGKRKVRNRRRV